MVAVKWGDFTWLSQNEDASPAFKGIDVFEPPEYHSNLLRLGYLQLGVALIHKSVTRDKAIHIIMTGRVCLRHGSGHERAMGERSFTVSLINKVLHARRPHSKRMMGRVFDRRRTSVNPAARKADGTPVHTKGSGVFSIVGSTG